MKGRVFLAKRAALDNTGCWEGSEHVGGTSEWVWSGECEESMVWDSLEREMGSFFFILEQIERHWF